MKNSLTIFHNGISFLRRQPADWKTTVLRTSLERLAYQTVFPYLSIYIVALGATATQLGMVNSIGMVIAGLFSPLIGWSIDRKGPKNPYLIGIGLLAVSYLTYSLAQTWPITIIAMIAYWLGYSTAIHSCATICGKCLINRDRATAMTVCESVAAGLLGMVGPMIGAWLVMRFGGINVTGIRPLFFAGLIITIGSFIIVLTRLSVRNWAETENARLNLFRDSLRIFKGNRYLKRWIVISAIMQLPLGMIMPFSQVFAHEIKGATEFILGAMVTGAALTSVTFAIPLGRLADNIGRKKALYIIIPLFWSSNLLLIWSPSPAFLIIAGILQGFYFIGGPLTSAIERELVPMGQLGRWIGINRFFRMSLNACMALVAGIIWDKIGPQYVFLVFICLDLVVRMPLLISLPETLYSRFELKGA
jgi:MFS family permease